MAPVSGSVNGERISEEDEAASLTSSSDEASEVENVEQTIVDMGRHERMQRIQQVLYDQLKGNDYRITLELREKEEELRGMKKKREDVGVALYGVQQHLAKLQLALEASHSKVSAFHDERFQAEDRLDEWRELVKQKTIDLDHRRGELNKTQTELDALNATLRQVEAYNKEIKSEISRTQRAAHKTEKSMTTMEKDKVKQDLYIDSLNDQIKNLHGKIEVLVVQLKRQKGATTAAEKTVREASEQMEAIAFEKKQLIIQWKSALISMQKRDRALQATQEAITRIEEEDMSLATEIRGYTYAIEKSQRVHETLTATIERFSSEIRFVEEQIVTLQQEHDRLSERYKMLAKSLKQTEVQAAAVSAEGKKLEEEASQIQTQLETTQKERHALEDQIAIQKNAETIVNKAAHNASKETQRLQKSVHENEIALAKIQNEIARVNVETLNIQAQTGQLIEAHSKYTEELKQTDLQVEKIELEIRQRNDEIEKKMLRLDRLNKKYEQLVSKMEDENTGPLEATIKMISRDIGRNRKLNADKQKEWLQLQTSLIQLSSDSQEMSEINQQLTSKTSVSEQRSLRLQSQIDAMRKDMKDLKLGIETMHNDIIKLNDLISKQNHRQEELLSINHGLELEFKQELRSLESDSIFLESQATQLKMEKQALLDRIVEIERQLLLWEKKLQLEKETQAALDPEVGQAEAKSMEKEIHRMRIRFEALQRSQEQMLQDMEQAIHKRDIIAMRGRSKKDTELTYASLTTKVSTLQNNLRNMEKRAAKVDNEMKTKLVHSEDLSFQLENITAELKAEEEKSLTLQQSINNGLYEKQRLVDAEARKQKLLKRFDHLCKAAMTSPEEDSDSTFKVQQDRERSKQNLDAVKNIIVKLQDQNPHLLEILNRVSLLAEEPPVN
ncbi:unnamed protein product [Albugo candida]|uniref:Coiled-coil domain-containing protein 40 n=1 Tax=Albugo candida TaxID=65357 RepID=A0A024G4U1_9STRA|nr:unnamed protein product [Albugo candida]|eukprot:CCI41776.1 unnamed protein product [Albugo candida]